MGDQGLCQVLSNLQVPRLQLDMCWRRLCGISLSCLWSCLGGCCFSPQTVLSMSEPYHAGDRGRLTRVSFAFPTLGGMQTQVDDVAFGCKKACSEFVKKKK